MSSPRKASDSDAPSSKSDSPAHAMPLFSETGDPHIGSAMWKRPTLPDGDWNVQIQGVKGVMRLRSDHIITHQHGFLFYHPSTFEAQEARWSFCPHHRIERMWQVTTQPPTKSEGTPSS